MGKDIRFKTDEYNFHLRTVAVIVQNNKYLIQKVEGFDYYILPGGHVELGEDSKKAIIREVKEEIGCDVKDLKLFCLYEHCYPYEDKIEHWVETYFKITPDNDLSNNSWNYLENDKGEEKLLHFKWVTSEELKMLDFRPQNIKNILVNNKTNELIYLTDA